MTDVIICSIVELESITIKVLVPAFTCIRFGHSVQCVHLNIIQRCGAAVPTVDIGDGGGGMEETMLQIVFDI